MEGPLQFCSWVDPVKFCIYVFPVLFLICVKTCTQHRRHVCIQSCGILLLSTYFFSFDFFVLILCIILVRFKAECMWKVSNCWLSSYYYHWKESRRILGNEREDQRQRSTFKNHWRRLLMPSSPLLFFEIPNRKTETQVLLNLFPDRIGHGTFLSSSEEGSLDLVDFVRQHQIPLGKASGPPGNCLTLPPRLQLATRI